MSAIETTRGLIAALQEHDPDGWPLIGDDDGNLLQIAAVQTSPGYGDGPDGTILDAGWPAAGRPVRIPAVKALISLLAEQDPDGEPLLHTDDGHAEGWSLIGHIVSSGRAVVLGTGDCVAANSSPNPERAWS